MDIITKEESDELGFRKFRISRAGKTHCEENKKAPARHGKKETFANHKADKGLVFRT